MTLEEKRLSIAVRVRRWFDADDVPGGPLRRTVVSLARHGWLAYVLPLVVVVVVGSIGHAVGWW